MSMSGLRSVPVDVLTSLMTSSLDAAVAPVANARSTAATLLARLADHDAVGAVHLLDDAVADDVARMVGDVTGAANTISAVHQALRSASAHADPFGDMAVRRIADGASRLAMLPTDKPRNVYMAAVSAGKTADAMQITLDGLRRTLGAVPAS